MRALDYRKLDLATILTQLRSLCSSRAQKDWAEADIIKNKLVALDSGMRLTLYRDGKKATLWHWPSPPFSDQYHYANYGEFVANSDE